MDPITQQTVLAAAGAGGGDPVYVDDVFSTFLYDGTGSTQSINNGIDLAGEGGLVWIKNRDYQYSHRLYDTERGVQEYLESQSSTAETSQANGLTNFNSNGFTIGSMPQINEGTANYEKHVSWSFRKAPGFFDVVTYTGDGTDSRTISHSLGSEPGMIILKRFDGTADWPVYHRSKKNVTECYLNGSNDFSYGAGTWFYHDGITSTTFGVDNLNDSNGLNKTYVAYLFAHDDASFGTDEDESIIKCGSWSGTGSAFDIDIGFEAQWIMYKNADATGDWYITDSMRGLTVQGTDSLTLKANTNEVENGSGNFPAPYSKGFRVISGDHNTSGNTYIYVAIRRPNKPPEAGTEVFNAHTVTDAGTNYWTPGFVPDLLIETKTNATADKVFTSRLTGNANHMMSNSTAAEAGGGNYFEWDSPTGQMKQSYFQGSADYLRYTFKRAPGFFDVVAYSGNSVNGRQISHNLGTAPELMLVKVRNVSDSWVVGHQSMGNGYYAKLDTTDAGWPNTGIWNNTSPTSTTFTTNGAYDVNYSGNTYIAYLFATLPGISKVGSWTGNNTNVRHIDCGFTNGARFVMVKRTDTAGDWYVWDTVRGINDPGSDPYILLNSSSAQVTNTDYIQGLSSGFSMRDGSTWNATGGTYIFLAIA